MTTAVLFPGQGSQAPGMGSAFIDAWPETAACLEQLDDRVDLDLQRVCRRTGAAEVRDIRTVQVATFGVGVAVWAGLRELLPSEPIAVAGHSLGHWTAFSAAGGVDPTIAVEWVHRRADSMAGAAASGAGRMVAVLGVPAECVERACEGDPDVSVAAYNTRNQTVISGSSEAVTATQERIRADATGVRFRELAVPAAFHSPIMRPARVGIEGVLEHDQMVRTDFPVVSDVTGVTYQDPTVAARDLVVQTTAPVDWVAVVNRLCEMGVDRVIEVPPAGTLTALTARIAPSIDRMALTDPGDIEE